MKALLITAFAGAFFLVGAILTCFGKKKKALVDFSIGMAFSVMLMLVAFDIVPEILELLEGQKNYMMYIFIIIGIVMLKLIDMLVPHHDHESEKKHHERHLNHIGIISSLALIIHNIIEGMAIYNLAVIDIKMGLSMALGVGLHNIPFGMEITVALNETKKNKSNVFISIALLCISTVFGALFMMIFGTINDYVLAGLMSITVGMIIYLLLFELLIEIGSSKNKKTTTTGLIVGALFMIFNFIIGG